MKVQSLAQVPGNIQYYRKSYTVFTVNMVFYSCLIKSCIQNILFFVFFSWRSSLIWPMRRTSPPFSESFRYSALGMLSQSESKEGFTSSSPLYVLLRWVSCCFFSGRHTLKAWIKTLSLPQSKPLAAVLPTSERWGTRVWTAWCSCCPTEMVSLSVLFTYYICNIHMSHI